MALVPRKSRRVREPPTRQRELWKGLKQCKVEEVPSVLREQFRQEVFTSSSKGELGAWLEGITKCDGWLRRWLDGNGRKLDFTKAFMDETTKNLTIPAAGNDNEVLLVLSFLSCLLEHSRNKALFNAVHTISLFLNSPSVDVVQEALLVLHWFAGSHRQRHQLVPFDKSAQHKLVSIASGWGPVPSLLSSVGLSDTATTDVLDTLEYTFFSNTYRTCKKDGSPATPSTAPLKKAAEHCSAFTSPSGQTTVTIKIGNAMSDKSDLGGPIDDRPREILEYVVSSQSLPFHHTYPLWTRLRMAANVRNSDKLCKWAICRMLALAVLASANDDMLRTFLEHSSDWFQEVTTVLSDDNAPYSVVTAVLQLLSVLLSSPNAREALSSSDLRGSALSPTTLAASQGRLLDMLRAAPQGMTESNQLTPEGELKFDAQNMYTALFGFASVFAVNQGQTNIRTLNTVIIVPFLQVPRLRVPGTEKVAAKCLNVMESLLAQDNLKEQVIEAGCTELLIQLLQEEVMLVDVSKREGEPVEEELVVPVDEVPWELRTRLEKRRRLSHDREVVLTHLLRALALCIGSTQGHPVALFDNKNFREPFRRMLSYPEYYGHATYKFAAHVLIQLINTDHTVCPAVVNAGFLDLVIGTIKSPPEDPRFTLVLPQLLVAFCLCGKGVDIIKKANMFKYILEPLRGDKTWFMLSPSDAITLGTELNDLVRHVKPLLDECFTALTEGLTIAVDKMLEWEPAESTSVRPLYVLQHHVLVLDGLLRIATEKMASRKSGGTLLQAIERVCHIFHRPNLSLERTGLSPKILPLFTDLKLDLQCILSSTVINATWDIFTELERAAKQLTEDAYDAAKWESPAAAPTQSSKLPVTPWPLKDGEQHLTLHTVATVAHLLHIFVTLEGKRSDARLPAFLSEWVKHQPSTCLKSIVHVVLGVKKWQVTRSIEKQQKFQHVSKSSDASPVSQRSVDEKKRATVMASVTSALCSLVYADMEKDLDDPVYMRRDRVSSMFTEACLALMDLLCRAIVPNTRDITQPAIKDVSGQLAKVAYMFISYVKEHIENPDVSFEMAASLFDEIVLGPWCTKIIGVLYDPTSRKYKEHCSLLVIKAFEGDGGIELLCDTCVALLLRTLDRPVVEGEDTEPAVGALKILVKYARKHFIEDAPHARALESANRNSFEAAAFARKVRNVIAEKILPVWKHPKLGCRPNVTMKLLELVGVIVKQGDWLNSADVRSARRARPVKQEFKPDEETIAQLIEMGFPRGRVRHALIEIGQNSAEMATEWLLTHISEGDEEEEEDGNVSDEMAKAIAMSLEGEKEDESSEDKEKQPEPKSASRILADECLAVALRLGDDNPALAFCATDILCLLADVLDMPQAVMNAVLDSARSELEAGMTIDNHALVRTLIQLSLLIPHNVMQQQKQTLASSQTFTKSLANLLKYLDANVPSKADEAAFNKHVEFTKVVLSVVDALIIPMGPVGKSEPKPGSPRAKEGGAEEEKDKPEEWNILLRSANEPVVLPEDITSELLTSLTSLIDKGLPTTPVHQIIAILDRLVTSNHNYASQLHATGFLEKLLNTQFEGHWQSHTVAGHIASIIKHIIEDPDYLQSTIEASIRKVYNKFVTDTPAGINNGTVEWFTPAQLQQDSGAAVETKEAKETKDKKKKRSGKKKEKEKDKEKDKDKEKEKAGDEEGEASTESTSAKQKIPLVKLQPFMTELDRVRKKNPSLFLTTLTSCCKLVYYTRAGESKPTRFIELRPSAKDTQPRGRRLSIRRKTASLMADEIMQLLLTCIYDRLDESSDDQPTCYALAVYQLIHLTGEMVVQYPSTLTTVLASKKEHSYIHYLLNHFLTYTTSPTERDQKPVAMLKPNAARFVLQQVAVRQPEQIAPEIIQTLEKSCDGTKGMGIIHSASDLIMELLSRPTKANEKVSMATQLVPPSAITKELLKAGLINVLCQVMKNMDLKHPNSAEAVCSLMRTINAAIQHAQNVPDKDEAKEEAPEQIDCDEEADNAADDVQLDVGGEVLQVEVMEGEAASVYEEEEEEEEEEEDGPIDDFVLHMGHARHEDDDDEEYEMVEDEGWGFPRMFQGDESWVTRELRDRHVTGTYNFMRHIMLDGNEFSPLTLSENGQPLPFQFAQAHRTPNSQVQRRPYSGNLMSMSVPTGPVVVGTAPTSYAASALAETPQPNSMHQGVIQSHTFNFRDLLRGPQTHEEPTTSQLSYSADAVEDAIGAYLGTTAPDNVLVIEETQAEPEHEPEPESEQAETAASPTTVPNPAVDTAEPPPEVPEAATEGAAPERAPEVHRAPEAPVHTAAVDPEEMDLEEQLRLALGMSLEESGPPDQTEASPAAEADLLASELNRALALSMSPSASTPAGGTQAVPEPAADPQVPEASPQATAPESAPEPPAPALDPTFVSALPEDLRRDVLRENVHLLMTQSEPGENGSTIDPTFLAALPAAIQEEVIGHERRILAQRQASQSGAGTSQEDIDPASFIVSLLPELRQEILSTSDDSFIAQLPPDLAAEAQALREARWMRPEYAYESQLQELRSMSRQREPAVREQEKWAKKVVVDKKPVKQVIDTSVLASFVRVLYMNTSTMQPISLEHTLKQLLTTVTAHPVCCRAVFALLLYILSNGEANIPSDIVGAERCIMSYMYNVPTYLAGTTPALPLIVPPLVMLNTIDLMSNLADVRSQFLNSLDEAASGVLTATTLDKEACVDVVKKTVLYNLLELHGRPSFSCSPKLSEALTKLIQKVCERLCSQVNDDSDTQTQKIVKRLNKERVLKLQEWHESSACRLMASFDFDAEGAENKVFEEAFQKRAEVMTEMVSVIQKRHTEFVKEKMTHVDKEAPTANQRLAAFLFAHPSTLTALVKVLETADTTNVAVSNCLSTLNAMCGLKLSSVAKQGVDGVSVARRLMQELLVVAERIANGAAEYLSQRTEQIRAALAEHMEHQESDAEDKHLPSSVMHFFITDDPATHEVQLQRLTKTLSSVAHHEIVDCHRESRLEGGGVFGKPTIKQLQGKWRTTCGNIVHVRHTHVVFERANGSFSDAHEFEEANGQIKLMGCKVEQYGGNWCEWDDGDIWRAEDGSLQQGTSYPRFKVVLGSLWAEVDAYLMEMGKILQTVGEGFQPPARVLPLVEAFFSFHEIDPQSRQAQQPLLPIPASAPVLVETGELLSQKQMLPRQASTNILSSTASLDELEMSDPVKTFIVRNRKLLNALIKTNPSLLSNSLRAMISYSSMIEFANKRTWFREKIRKDQESHARQQMAIKVSRHNVFHDSYLLLRRPAESLKGKLRVSFKGEDGVDGGGLRREWFQVLAKEMFNPMYALFVPSEEGNTFQPNPNSSVNEADHLSYFNFVGRVVGLAVYNDVMLDAYFTRSLYKHMLGIPPDYRDVQSINEEYYRNLVWMLENDITDVLEYNFTIDVEKFGVHETIELCHNGKDISVTNQNKHEYVQLIAQHKMTTNIKDQLTEFLKGFYDVVPRHLIQIFTPEELELLICGTPEVDVADWKANTDYVGYTSTSPQISWFWKVVDTMTHEEKLLLLQFITGTSKVPLAGFRDLEGMTGKQKFNIHKIGNPTHLPSSHTCFNQLDLPEYESYEQLHSMIRKAVLMGHFGFGFI